jgi:catechol 2,3-dioxygenase-like lactoylglutathione lyase family enzyme
MTTRGTPVSPIDGIDFTRYFVKDLERTTAFYRDTLGLCVFESPVCSFAFARDSEGNTFMLHQRR